MCFKKYLFHTFWGIKGYIFSLNYEKNENIKGVRLQRTANESTIYNRNWVILKFGKNILVHQHLAPMEKFTWFGQ